MIFTVETIENRIQMWALRNLPKDRLNDFIDDEFLDLLNNVLKDFNALGAIRTEKYLVSTSDGETNYALSGDIVKVFSFFYESSDFALQYWAFTADTIVLKETPSGEVQMIITFLRDTEDVATSTDEIDLPETLQLDFLALVKEKMKVEFGTLEEAVYQAYLEKKARGVRAKSEQDGKSGVQRYWILPEKGDNNYEITENFVSEDSIVADVLGHYSFID